MNSAGEQACNTRLFLPLLVFLRMPYLNLDQWPRRAHFDFYRTFEMPMFTVDVQVDVAPLKAWTDEHGASFFLAILYLSQQAVHAVAPFRYRLRNDRVWVHDTVDAGATVLRDDDTFAFAYFEHAATFADFQKAGQSVIETARASTGLTPRENGDALIHYSVLPWLHFTGFQNARSGNPTADAIPKIVFGQYQHNHNSLQMPVSVTVHHALLDGLHVGQYVEALSTYCAHPTAWLMQ